MINQALLKKIGTVGVLLGGHSSERDISLQSGAAVIKALDELGIKYVSLDLEKNNINALQDANIDRAFIALHGAGGEDGRMQALLELLNTPYTGSGVQASVIAMDKLLTKQLWRDVGVNTPNFEVLNEHSNWSKVIDRLGGEVMVKPVHEGSSIGMARVDSAAALASAYKVALGFDQRVIAETLMRGNEYTVAILNGVALPAIKLETKNSFYDFEAKYQSDDTSYICPSGLSDEREEELRHKALEAFMCIGCQGWGRVDVMEDLSGEFNMLEVNTVPGMTSHSLVPMAAKAKGLPFNDLVLSILEGSL